MMTPRHEKTASGATAPRALLEKIVVNAGVGRASQSPQFEEKILPQIMRDMALIAGQRPQVRKARKSIAGFKVREGQTVGIKATLRRKKMLDFLDRMIRMVLPRVKDFAGISLHALDSGGTLHVGFKEQYVFPEINPEESVAVFSLGVNIVPRSRDRKKAEALYRELGMPFRKKEEAVPARRRSRAKTKNR